MYRAPILGINTSSKSPTMMNWVASLIQYTVFPLLIAPRFLFFIQLTRGSFLGGGGVLLIGEGSKKTPKIGQIHKMDNFEEKIFWFFFQKYWLWCQKQKKSFVPLIKLPFPNKNVVY